MCFWYSSMLSKSDLRIFPRLQPLWVPGKNRWTPPLSPTTWGQSWPCLISLQAYKKVYGVRIFLIDALVLIVTWFCSCYYKWLFCSVSWVTGGSRTTIFGILAESVVHVRCQRCFNCLLVLGLFWSELKWNGMT